MLGHLLCFPGQAARKPKTQYTFSSMSRTAAAQATAQKTKVIDMTGRETRVFNSYAELGGPRKPVCGGVLGPL
jgi:hypothetical protein